MNKIKIGNLIIGLTLGVFSTWFTLFIAKKFSGSYDINVLIVFTIVLFLHSFMLFHTKRRDSRFINMWETAWFTFLGSFSVIYPLLRGTLL